MDGVISLSGGWGIVFWIIVTAALIVIEMATVQLVCIWFAVGALFAALACFVDAAFWLQLLIFLVSSIAALIVGRPLFVDRLTPKKQATNADRVIGQLGTVLQEVNNIAQTGRVTANGLDWTARSAYGEVLPVGATVLVLQIDGVKLIVQPLPPEPPMPPPAPPTQSAPYQPLEYHSDPQPSQPVPEHRPEPEAPLFSSDEPLQDPNDPNETQNPQGNQY